MNRLTAVYVTTLAICLGGIWGILRAGSTLSAVADFGGKWSIESGPVSAAAQGEPLGHSITIDQSGQYFHLRFETGLTLDLKAADPPFGVVDKPTALNLAGGPWTLKGIVEPKEGGQRGSFVLSGPQAANLILVRAR